MASGVNNSSVEWFKSLPEHMQETMIENMECKPVLDKLRQKPEVYKKLCETVYDIFTKQGEQMANKFLIGNISRCDTEWYWDLMCSFTNDSPNMAFQKYLDPDFSKHYEEHRKSKEAQSGQVKAAEQKLQDTQEAANNRSDYTFDSLYADFRPQQANLLPMRAYQEELAEAGHSGINDIIRVPTSSGKTLVAVHIVREHLEQSIKDRKLGRVAFLVPTIPQVGQQTQYFNRALCDQFTVDSVIGGEAASPKSERILKSHVTVMTPQILVNMVGNMVKSEQLNFWDFSLLVFDECHHTTENHPYNILMQMYHDFKSGDQDIPPGKCLPQIIGMTASLGVGKGSYDVASVAGNHIITMAANMDSQHLSTVQHNTNELLEHVYVPLDGLVIVHRLNQEMMPSPGITYYSTDGQAQLVATSTPVCGPETKQLVNSEVNLEAPDGVETGPSHSMKEPYCVEFESKAIPMVLSVFKHYGYPQCRWKYFHCHISNCGDEELYRYVGTSSLKRRQFLERHTHLFDLKSDDDLVSLQPVTIYITVVTLAKQLLIRGGACLIQELFDYFGICPDIPLEARRDMIEEGKNHFLRFLQTHPWIFTVFPSRVFVSVRRNLPNFDYAAFISEIPESYELRNSSPTNGFVSGPPATPRAIPLSTSGWPTDEPHLHQQQLVTPTFANGAISSSGIGSTANSSYGSGSNLSMASVGTGQTRKSGNEAITDNDGTSLNDESTSSQQCQINSGMVVEELIVAPIFRLPDELKEEIFSYITDIPTKMNLEQVSKAISAVSKHPQSWKGIHKLELRVSDSISLNDLRVPFVKWPAAIRLLLDRTHINELHFDFDEFPFDQFHDEEPDSFQLDPTVLPSIMRVFNQNFLKMKLKILQFIHFTVVGPEPSVNQLRYFNKKFFIELLKLSVPYLEEINFEFDYAGIVDDDDDDPFTEVWSVVSKCHSLKSFWFDCYDVSVDLTAFIGKPLTDLRVYAVRERSGYNELDDLIKVMNNAKGEGIQTLRYDLFPENIPKPFKYFCDQLNEKSQKRLRIIRCWHLKVDEINYLYLVPSIFPNLEELHITNVSAVIDIDELSKIGVFASGPKSMVRSVDAACQENNLNGILTWGTS